MKRRYHLTVLGYYRSHDTTHQVSIDCDGMWFTSSGCYEFYKIVENDTMIPVAYYPIRQTIITSIEDLKSR